MLALPLPNIPEKLSALRTIALDLRWTWSHEADALWEYVDEKLWRVTRNPWSVLQNATEDRLRKLAGDSGFCRKLASFAADRSADYRRTGWFGQTYDASGLKKIAYFSMEFGLGEALPLYAGGLGVLAGDVLKTASDLDVPVVGIGLLYQEGYFRQIVDGEGTQQELYPYNEPATMPIEPALDHHGAWLRIPLELPGRTVHLRVWQANVGRVKLYLLDINEGHAAFAIIERAHQYARKHRLSFWQALWATRAGNVFTTHTPVAAGFDAFPARLLHAYLPFVEGDLTRNGTSLESLLALGRV